MWGVFPLYWPLLKPSGAGEVLAHRILWSLIVVVVLLAVGRRWAWMRTLGSRRLGLLTAAAFVLGINWLVFIWAVNNGQVVQTSLGYFTNPLVLVLLGVFVLHERLRPAQWAAVSLAAVAVVVLTLDFGGLPWVALSLAFSFAAYGLLKKTADVGPVESLSVETAALLLPALGFVVWLGATGESTFGSEGTGHALLIAASGVVTAIPLLCFGAAAVRIPLSTLGCCSTSRRSCSSRWGCSGSTSRCPRRGSPGSRSSGSRWRSSASTVSVSGGGGPCVPRRSSRSERTPATPGRVDRRPRRPEPVHAHSDRLPSRPLLPSLSLRHRLLRSAALTGTLDRRLRG
jgi:RarD protein